MNQQKILESLVKPQLKTDVPALYIGDQMSVHLRIVEGDKERTQVFSGVLISRSGSGINEMIVIRKVVDEVGVERILPINSPMIAKFEVLRRGDARRAKLYYLEERVGKSRRLRDRRRGLKHTASDSLGTQSAAQIAAASEAAAAKKA